MSPGSQNTPGKGSPEHNWVNEILDEAFCSSSESDALRRVRNRLKPILIYDWHEPQKPEEFRAVSEFTERLAKVYETVPGREAGKLSFSIEAPLVHEATFPDMGVCCQVAGLFQARDAEGRCHAFFDGSADQRPSFFFASRYGLGEMAISFDGKAFSRAIAYSEAALHDEVDQFSKSKTFEPLWLRPSIHRFCYHCGIDFKALLLDKGGHGGEILDGQGKFLPFKISLTEDGRPDITNP